jgi:hypothetical protein
MQLENHHNRILLPGMIPFLKYSFVGWIFGPHTGKMSTSPSSFSFPDTYLTHSSQGAENYPTVRRRLLCFEIWFSVYSVADCLESIEYPKCYIPRTNCHHLGLAWHPQRSARSFFYLNSTWLWHFGIGIEWKLTTSSLSLRQLRTRHSNQCWS